MLTCSNDVVKYATPTPAPHDPPDEATISLTTFIYTTVGLSMAIIVVMGGAVGAVTGLIAMVKRLQGTTINNSTQSSVSPVSSVGGEASAVVDPEYEEISLHEATNVYLTDNAAYGCSS
jgi:hypothetical protein